MDSVFKLTSDWDLLDDLFSTPKRKKASANSNLVDDSFSHSIKSTYCCNNCKNENIRIIDGNHFILQILTEEYIYVKNQFSEKIV